jgi:hypothetical protein
MAGKCERNLLVVLALRFYRILKPLNEEALAQIPINTLGLS